MLHEVPVCNMRCIAGILGPCRLIVVIHSCFLDTIGGILSDGSDDCGVARSRTLSAGFHTLLLWFHFPWLLVADLDIGQVVLVIAVHCPSDSICLALWDAPLISVNKLVLSSIVRIFVVMEWISSHLNLAAIDSNFLSIFPVRSSPSLFRLFPLWYLLILKNTPWREYAKLKRVLHAISHGSFRKFPPGYAFSHSWGV